MFGSATGKSCMFTVSTGLVLCMFWVKNKSLSYRMVWWSVAGFSVLQQTAQRTRCLYTLMGPAARNADVSISSTHLDQAGSKGDDHNQTCDNPLCCFTKRLSHHTNRLVFISVSFDLQTSETLYCQAV